MALMALMVNTANTANIAMNLPLALLIEKCLKDGFQRGSNMPSIQAKSTQSTALTMQIFLEGKV